MTAQIKKVVTSSGAISGYITLLWALYVFIVVELGFLLVTNVVPQTGSFIVKVVGVNSKTAVIPEMFVSGWIMPYIVAVVLLTVLYCWLAVGFRRTVKSWVKRLRLYMYKRELCDDVEIAKDLKNKLDLRVLKDRIAEVYAGGQPRKLSDVDRVLLKHLHNMQ